MKEQIEKIKENSKQEIMKCENIKELNEIKVKYLGKKGELVDINEGYARNFVLKKKLGIEATVKNLNDLKLKKAN